MVPGCKVIFLARVWKLKKPPSGGYTTSRKRTRASGRAGARPLTLAHVPLAAEVHQLLMGDSSTVTSSAPVQPAPSQRRART